MMKKFYGIFIMLLMVQLSFAQKVSVPQLNAPENEFETAMPDVILDWSAVSGVGVRRKWTDDLVNGVDNIVRVCRRVLPENHAMCDVIASAF